MINKIFIILTIFVLFFNFAMPVFAYEIDNVHLVKIGMADYHLKYYHEERGSSSYVVCSVIGYYNNNIFFPTYCMNRNLPGAETEEYNINISQLLNNDAVWRVVTNGYPYVTANQMGLENDFDAYAVTKFAIYCVLGEANLDYYSYEPGDIVGQRMFDVLRYLVNVGINGEDTPKTGTISMTKTGELVECENYYYQEYKVDSRINMDKYEIINISDFPNDSYIADCFNNPQNVFKFGNNFRIFIPKNGFSSDINGKIAVKGKVENYPVFYGEAPIGKQNYVSTFDSYGEEEKETILNIKTNTGKLKVYKIDKETKLPLNGIKFSLTGNDKTYEGVTDEKGELIFENLYPGRYTLIEIETNESHSLNDQTFDIDISYKGEEVITIDNEAKKGKLRVLKIDKDTKEPIEGVKFEILDYNTKEIIEELITNTYGIAESSELRIDKEYILKESWNNNKYLTCNQEYVFSLDDENIVELEIENEKIKGSIKIKKVDEENKQIPLSKVKFELYDNNMNLLEELETDENGEVYSKEYPSVNEIYYLKEVKTNEKYKLNDELIKIKLIDKNVLEILVTNKKIPEEVETPKLPKTGK